jgi:two-component system, NtrC family, C4-dicarboxylate transport response regulator DctD
MQPIVYTVDGEERTRQSLTEAIESTGVQTRGFASAEAFLQFRWRRQSAYLLAEIDLPGISGLELLSRMRQLEASIPTLLITSRYEVPLAVEAVKLGATDLIPKPVVTGALLRRLARLLDKTA